jgi:hypothetical protein
MKNQRSIVLNIFFYALVLSGGAFNPERGLGQKKSKKIDLKTQLEKKYSSSETLEVLEFLRDQTAETPSARDIRVRAEWLDKKEMPLSALLDRRTLLGIQFGNASDIQAYSQTAIEYGLSSEILKRSRAIERQLERNKETQPVAYRYAKSIAYFNQGQIDRATQELPESLMLNSLREAARFEVLKTRSGIHAARGNLKEALDVLGSGRNFSDSTWNSLLSLYRAQLSYDLNRWGQTLDEISGIPRNSPGWHSASLVGAWTAYRKKDLNLALGALMTLNSPFLKAKFSPESRILEAATLFELCQYQAAKKTLQVFFDQYKNFSKVVERFNREYGQSLQGVGYVLNYVRGSSRAPSGYNQASWDILMDGLLSQDLFLQVDSLVQQSQLEAVLWGKVDSRNRKANREWKKSYIQRLAQLQTIGLQLGLKPLRLGVSRMRQLIQDALEGALIIEVEVDTRLRDRLLKGQSALERTLDFDANVKEGFEFWPFQGEFWRDETAHYMFSTVDVCEGQ